MCGIFGILFHQSELVPEVCKLNASAQLMRHRGPDAQQIYAQKSIGLAHARLSLLDPNPRSHQPFWDRDNKHCLVYNGEIYNFRQLRAELEARGVKFRTSSDTEVLLESLLNDGVESTLSRLEGMFAFALFDKEAETLVLARDRLGIKPLVVYESDGEFIFASEIQAMRPWIQFEPDCLSISSYLQHGVWPGNFCIPTKNHSFYKNIRIVPPGSKIEVRRGSRALFSSYHSLGQFLDEQEHARLARLKPQAIVDELDQRLHDSVKMQLVADAPVGALCGGGVDSSLILALAAKYHNNLAIFHADIVDCSEYEAARALSNHLKLDLQSVTVSERSIIDNLIPVMEYYGHPCLYHPSSVPFFIVSKLVQEHGVKAVLTGEGADECFVGYPWKIPTLRQRAKHLIKRLINRSSGPMGNGNHDDVVKDLHNRFEISGELAEIRQQVQDSPTRDWKPNDLLIFELLGYHLRTLLHRNDCLGMSASVESRFPLLDSEVVKLAVNMPYSLKVRFSPVARHPRHPFLIDKWIFRQVAARHLPEVMCKRPKMGFHVPCTSRLSVKPDFFAHSFVADFFSLSHAELSHLIERADREVIQKLLFLEIWAQVCLLNGPRQQFRQRLESNLYLSNN